MLLYRVQFGTQPQNPNGPQFQLQGVGGRGHQTYDVLREGVDYFMDRSMLWFALARELNETNERLVVAYNVRLNGRDTIWTTTGGTPDLQVVKTRDQVANLVWEPNLSPSSSTFRREIRSAYRLAGEDLVRSTTQVRVVAGTAFSSVHRRQRRNVPPDARLAQSTNPAEFDYDNRIWPATDAVFNLAAGAPDVERTIARSRPIVPRSFHHSSVAASLLGARRRARRSRQSDKRRDLHHAGRVSVLCPTSDVDLPAPSAL